jgi:hypothetical protein
MSEDRGPSGGGVPGPGRRRVGPRGTGLVGVLFLAAVVGITINTLQTDGPGSRGVPAGDPLPPFAAPLATSDVDPDTDANVAVEGEHPACEVRGPHVLNSCELAERGPVVLAFLATRSGRCERQIDALDRIRARFPGVRFAAVAIRADRDDLRRTIRRRRWNLPVAYDHDGAVSNLYAVAVCPTIVFAHRGGKVAETTLGSVGERELIRRVARL